jgi:hypothetical protein
MWTHDILSRNAQYYIPLQIVELSLIILRPRKSTRFIEGRGNIAKTQWQLISKPFPKAIFNTDIL